MKRIVVGVIGHVDHGKTALVKALTGIDTDRLPEERQRGISIALGFAHFEAAPGVMVDLVDMPGHERFVRTMVAGATEIDAVLLVVAANESIRPQTIEHTRISSMLGIAHAVVAVAKCDLVTAEDARMVAAAAQELLAGSGIADAPFVMTSSRNGLGIDDLGRVLADLAGHAAVHATDGNAYLPIDRAFSVAGHGPVVTGTLRGAALATGDTLELLPSGAPVRVRSVQVHGARVQSALPGQRVAVNLRGVDNGDLARGMALSAPGALEVTEWLTIALQACRGAHELRNGQRLRALSGTGEAAARLRLLDRDVLLPGEAALAQLRVPAGVAVPVREAVVVRVQGAAGTVGGGIVLDAQNRRMRRHDVKVLERLHRLRDAPPATIMADEIAACGSGGTTLRQLARLTGLAQWRVAEMLAELPVTVIKGGAVVPDAEIERRKRLALRPDAAHNQGDAERATAIAAALQQAGLAPPLPKEIVTDAAAHRAVERLLRSGTLIRAIDRAKGKELLFHADAITAALTRLSPLLGDGAGMLVGEITEALGITRKFAMPLLDHLDGIGFTRRVGDRRILCRVKPDR